MAGLRFQNPAPQFRDLDDDVAVGGRLYFYTSGTLTPAATYSDEDLTVPNPNPVELDAFGRSETSIFLDPSVVYRCVLKDADLQVIWDRDPLSGSDIAAAIAAHNEDPNAHLDATETNRGMVELANANEAKAGTEPLKVMTPATNKALLQDPGYVTNTRQGTNIASAASINLEAATGNTVDVTGTTGITSVTLEEGHIRTVRFTGALTLTHSSTLVLPGGKNITTAAGDFAVFVGAASDVVRVVSYSRASGYSIAGTGPIIAASASLNTSGDTTFTIPVVAMDEFKLRIFIPDGAADDYIAYVRFNSDSSGNYSYITNTVTTGGSDAASDATATSGICLLRNDSLTDKDFPASIELTIQKPQSTTVRKIGLIKYTDFSTSGDLRSGYTAVTWNSTAAITSIQILLRDSGGAGPTGLTVNAPTGSTYVLLADPGTT